jgi:uncharacterized lipoprotein YbaY/heat shock protein HslJ/uncharacterized lipoprotein NlpE involved in copper resistance
MRYGFTILAVLLALGVVRADAAEEGQVSGTASYRERIALPPGAVFEAVLEDVTVADVPADQLGTTVIDDPGNPPFQFEIAFDREKIDPSHTYSVRAQVSVGRKLIFVSDTINPVLTRGAADTAEIWMIKVGDTTEEARNSPTSIGAHGLRLPASFEGELPCPDCEALRYRLNLWPDQVFHLRRVWEGKDLTRDSVGRWSVDPDRHILDLRGAEEELRFGIVGPDQLQLLARDGTPIQTEGDYTLTAGDDFEPFEPHLPLRGMLTYVEDSARFTECLTGRDYPLVKDGDYEALEHAYLAAGAEAGGPIMASFDGGIVQVPGEDGDTMPKVMVERFVGVWPGETCERALGEASLTNTYWKILRLGETEVAAGPDRREPNLILREGEPRFTATVGRNQVSGGYTLEDDKLMFGTAAATMMACPAPLDDWERQLAVVLTETASWRIDGQTLELLDDAGEPLALLQAVYLY